jgi:hypothetical protein
MTEWQRSLPHEIPRHIKRNIELGDEGCWLWKRSKSKDGYGWASLGNKTFQAHRLVYRLVKGSLSDGLVLDHLCRVRHCVNPSHMEEVTPRENIKRSELTPTGAKKCRLGHDFIFNGRQRRCLVCLNEYELSRKEKKAEQERERRRNNALASIQR